MQDTNKRTKIRAIADSDRLPDSFCPHTQSETFFLACSLPRRFPPPSVAYYMYAARQYDT